MENKKRKTLSAAGLIISVLPLATLVPVFLHITLAEGVSRDWACANIAFVAVGLVLSGFCAKSIESRSPVNIAALAISGFWALLMFGIVATAWVLTLLR